MLKKVAHPGEILKDELAEIGVSPGAGPWPPSPPFTSRNRRRRRLDFKLAFGSDGN